MDAKHSGLQGGGSSSPALPTAGSPSFCVSAPQALHPVRSQRSLLSEAASFTCPLTDCIFPPQKESTTRAGTVTALVSVPQELNKDSQAE